MNQYFDTIINFWDNKYRYTDDIKLMTFYQARGLRMFPKGKKCLTQKRFKQQKNCLSEKKSNGF